SHPGLVEQLYEIVRFVKMGVDDLGKDEKPAWKRPGQVVYRTAQPFAPASGEVNGGFNIRFVHHTDELLGVNGPRHDDSIVEVAVNIYNWEACPANFRGADSQHRVWCKVAQEQLIARRGQSRIAVADARCIVRA